MKENSMGQKFQTQKIEKVYSSLHYQVEHIQVVCSTNPLVDSTQLFIILSNS